MSKAVRVVFIIISLFVTLYFLSNTMHAYDNMKAAGNEVDDAKAEVEKARTECFEVRNNFIAQYGELPEQYKHMCETN